MKNGVPGGVDLDGEGRQVFRPGLIAAGKGEEKDRQETAAGHYLLDG